MPKSRTFRTMVLKYAPYSKKKTTTSAKKREQTIIFTIARMNPPTLGHIELIKTLIVAAIKQGNNKVYILLQAGEKAGKEAQNPLTCSEKKRYLLEMISNLEQTGVNVEVICADDELDPSCKQTSDPLRQICDIYQREKFNPEYKTIFHLWVGTDRVADFTKFLGNVAYLPPNSRLITEELKREQGGISGTKLRGLAKQGAKEEFIKLEMAAGLSIESATELYDILYDRMNRLPNIYKKATKSTKATKGGRKKGRRKTKRRENKNKKLI